VFSFSTLPTSSIRPLVFFLFFHYVILIHPLPLFSSSFFCSSFPMFSCFFLFSVLIKFSSSSSYKYGIP
jgi:hypothetical protein